MTDASPDCPVLEIFHQPETSAEVGLTVAEPSRRQRPCKEGANLTQRQCWNSCLCARQSSSWTLLELLALLF